MEGSTGSNETQTCSDDLRNVKNVNSLSTSSLNRHSRIGSSRTSSVAGQLGSEKGDE